MDKMKQSFKMANRIKELRKEKAVREGRKTISHEFLSSEIKRIYGVDVKKDSLINYEISEKDRTKAENTPNLKMRVEVLLCLADYFGVSLDYLVGRSDIRRDEINGVLAVDLGLSDIAVDNLLELNSRGYKHDEQFLNTISYLLEQETQAPTSPAIYFDDEARALEAFEAEYLEWERQDFIPVLFYINELLNVKEDPTAVYDLTDAGQISKNNPATRWNIHSLRKITASDIIERVLLSDIEDRLKKLKAKYRANK